MKRIKAFFKHPLVLCFASVMFLLLIGISFLHNAVVAFDDFEPQFKQGQRISHVLDDREGIVVREYRQEVKIRVIDDEGEYQTLTVEKFEIKPKQ